MPELPEVETVARQLEPRIVGRTVQRLSILDARLRVGRTPRVAGRRIEQVQRSGKRVLVTFSRSPANDRRLWLAVHLRMTGRLLWVDDAERTARDHLRARFRLDRGELLFVDTRRFGTFDWYRDEADTKPEACDPLAASFTHERLAELIGDTRQCLKAWLLRQDRLVGLGNIYASEILHSARLSPYREAGSLTAVETRRLHGSTRRILARAIENCGTTISDFQDARGVEGSYGRFLAVYDRAGEPCRRCRSPLRRSVQQQRSTFYCPDCQG